MSGARVNRLIRRHRVGRRIAIVALAVGFVRPVVATESAANPTASSPPAARATRPLVLDRFIVLGSRIPRDDVEGISPVSVYGRDEIEATGAMRLADFLNYLPQNYTGASSGRGSAPNDLNPEFGVRTESLSPAFNFVVGAAAVPLGQSGVAGVNLRGLGSGSTLVLVDGRRVPIAGQGNRSTDSNQGFVDLNTISLGMVERIEVLTDGASALYGSDAIGGVINVVLKKNYTGAELATRYRGTFEGGGRERQATLTAGFVAKDARLRGTLSLDTYDRSKLSAAQREFSQNQDHRTRIVSYREDGTPTYGRDLRLRWGYPAVVQARTGNLAGLTDPGGAPVRIALVPEGARTTPAPAQFIPGQVVPPATAVAASDQRRTDSAAFLALVPPQASWSVRGALDYDFGENFRAYASWSHGDVHGRFDSQPPVSTPSAITGFGGFATVVPATIAGQPNVLNPFGQDVLVGFVHDEFGPTRQTTRTRSDGFVAGLSGLVAERWLWDAAIAGSRQRFAQRNLTLDPVKFTAALAAPDLAQGFNPFIDARAGGASNAALYPAMTTVDGYDGTSELVNASVLASGPLRVLPGGELQMAAGGEIDYARHRAMTRPAAGAPSDLRAQRHSYAAFAELSVPIFGRANARPLLRRLEAQLAGRYENHGPAGVSVDPKIGVAWAPFQPLRVRASYSTGFRVPSLTEYETPVSIDRVSLTDPRRTPASTSNVAVTSGSNSAAHPETAQNEVYGVVLAPPFAPGLSVEVTYHRTLQRDVLQKFSYDTIVGHEPQFPGRVTRAAPTPLDVALNQPGAILAVDATLVSFGAVINESLDLGLHYDVPSRRLGHVRVSVSATHSLFTRYELTPSTTLDLSGDTAAPPAWRWTSLALWSRENWSASVFAQHIGAFASNRAGNTLAPQGYPAYTTVNVSAGYTLQQGVWRGRGKGMKLRVGMDNLFNRRPPFSDTIFGFNGGLYSPLGRTYEFSVTVPF